MKIVLLAALAVLLCPRAHAAGEEAAPQVAKTEETVKITDETSQNLFERIRGAHLRAVQKGKVVASVPSTPKL